jgi:hypothetical protein
VFVLVLIVRDILVKVFIAVSVLRTVKSSVVKGSRSVRTSMVEVVMVPFDVVVDVELPVNEVVVDVDELDVTDVVVVVEVLVLVDVVVVVAVFVVVYVLVEELVEVPVDVVVLVVVFVEVEVAGPRTWSHGLAVS